MQPESPVIFTCPLSIHRRTQMCSQLNCHLSPLRTHRPHTAEVYLRLIFTTKDCQRRRWLRREDFYPVMTLPSPCQRIATPTSRKFLTNISRNQQLSIRLSSRRTERNVKSPVLCLYVYEDEGKSNLPPKTGVC